MLETVGKRCDEKPRPISSRALAGIHHQMVLAGFDPCAHDHSSH